LKLKDNLKILLLGQDVRQETRRFDESKKETILMRVKTDAVDYKYFTEPNIVPIKIDDAFIKNAIDTCPELYDHKLNRFIKDYKLDIVDAKILLNNIEIADFFEKVCTFSKNTVAICKFIISDVLGYLNKNNITIKGFKVEPKFIAEIVDLLKTGEINSSQGKDIFNKVIKENKSPLIIKKESNVSLISDEGTIRNMVNEILSSNTTLKADFKAGKDRVKGFVMGNLMKQTHGKINPNIANKIILEELMK